MDPPQGWIKMRQPIDVNRLGTYLQGKVSGFVNRDVKIWQANNGMSNPTYMLWSASRPKQKYVVRKKPPGKALPGAHQVDREYRILSALKNTKVPVPRVHILCNDEDVIGKAFYVMDFLEGRVCEDAELRKWTAGNRATLVADMVRVLAELHNQDFEKLGLENHGKRGHYGKRQLKTWGRQFQRGIPSIEANVHKHDKARLVLDYNDKMRELIRRLEIASEKIGECTTLVHGDFRIGNLMLRPEDPRILAVLDWEISTLGHPICDLAYMMGPWWIPGETNLSDLIGMPSEGEVLREYCLLRRIPMISKEEWQYWKALNAFRYGAICHGVYARGLQGNAGSTTAVDRWMQTVFSIELGLSILDEAESRL